MILKREKKQILTFNTLKPANIWIFSSINDLNLVDC